MIEWRQRYVCDNCEIVSGENHPIDVYQLKLKRTGKSFILCEKCVKELYETVQDIMQKEGIE